MKSQNSWRHPQSETYFVLFIPSSPCSSAAPHLLESILHASTLPYCDPSPDSPCRSEFNMKPLLGTKKHTAHRTTAFEKLDAVHLEQVSTSFIISDHIIAWCVWVQDVCLWVVSECLYVLMCTTEHHCLDSDIDELF